MVTAKQYINLFNIYLVCNSYEKTIQHYNHCLNLEADRTDHNSYAEKLSENMYENNVV